MKSTSNKEGKFTYQDFEKGLMLAGYISPQDTNEVIERNVLQEFDKSNAELNKKQYFKRTVLAAEIVSELKDEITFGRVKFQKMVYLCENVVHIKLADDRYKKFAAGPFDNRFMHSINREFLKQKWFEVKVVKSGDFSKPVYYELERINNYKDYYNKYFSEHNESIQRVISLLKTKKTDFVELVATIFHCWKEIIDEKKEFSNSLIHTMVHSWAAEKKRFTTKDIDNMIEWMEKENLTPVSI